MTMGAYRRRAPARPDGSNGGDLNALAVTRATGARTRNRSTSAPLAEPHCPMGLDKRFASPAAAFIAGHDAALSTNALERAGGRSGRCQ
jgi:hypothetical protein